ncbi:MAG: RluA family pseudouridine synthase [Candidatus Izemoplasmatales bacterium]|jgi:23S rRNA pseudouridine1911/1915/1917 synthase|nr:RluA family pseudouridine synthase [Candidatus Izemoplasmatales bacterium]NLF48516.1 RluA family pseudouridine synthase [Acholeplasmataceae bacterium]MDD4354303.1 RluA family pseudouridine synthase [Candidatus Izemoplasmatales bacterium]MDD4987307.1 RluA family pseudouridine synthase [Candidatus Izemoplasmatales bacterium]MDD5602309.1 RluA family pseudouridine synthase [Candidatus Izemoplasmatales bacterium]
MELKVLYEDNHVIVCVKPPGILSQKGSKPLPDMLTEIKSYLKEKYSKPGNVFLGLVHRLDLNVGGVMVFARTSKAASRLSQAIREGQFCKSYFALVEGSLSLLNPVEMLSDELKKDLEEHIASVDSSGKTAILKYESLAHVTWQKQKGTLVEITLVTGRFHQIRIQFASRGHPLFNDRKYGASALLKTNDIGLWAYRLQFPHPITREIQFFSFAPEGPLFSPYKKQIEPYLTSDYRTGDNDQ